MSSGAIRFRPRRPTAPRLEPDGARSGSVLPFSASSDHGLGDIEIRDFDRAPGARPVPAPLTPEAFLQATGVSRETLARLETYAALLVKWNRAINLVGRSTIGDLWRRHMLDSAQLIPLLPEPPPGRPRIIVDLGSGAGFPGLVLAMLGAGETHLIEADARKAVFLGEVARATETQVAIHATRIEALRPFPADVVTARACAGLARLLDYAAPFLEPGPDRRRRCLFLKGQRVDRELTAAENRWKITTRRIASRSDATGIILDIAIDNRAATKS